MRLKVDTSWWTRYRSRTNNPDLPPVVPPFPQAVPDLISKGPFPAIPRDDNDITIDPTGKHIQAIANTAAFHFASIEQGGSSLYPTLALRVSNPVVLRILPVCSIIRPVSTNRSIFGAVQAVKGLAASGLFNGQSGAFFKFVGELAEEADESTRKCDEDNAAAQVAVPVMATMSFFVSVNSWRAGTLSTTAGLKLLTSCRPREAADGDLFFGLAHFREVMGGLHPKPQVAAAAERLLEAHGHFRCRRASAAGASPRSLSRLQ